MLSALVFIHKGRDLQFKVDSEGQIFWDTFRINFIYSQSFWQKSAGKSLKKSFSYFSFFDIWYGAQTLALYLISQHTTYYLYVVMTNYVWLRESYIPT